MGEPKVVEERESKTGRGKRKLVSACLSGVSIFMLLSLVLVCIPLTVPRLFGYQVYYVVSGSMEPALPVGSLVYVRQEAPEEIRPEEIIAFYGAKAGEAVITHRVVENHDIMGEFITKGDANPTEDMNPVPYEALVGKVTGHVPVLGKLAAWLTGTAGKLLAGCAIGAALLMQAFTYLIEKH